jgi:hypothetical protein
MVHEAQTVDSGVGVVRQQVDGVTHASVPMGAERGILVRGDQPASRQQPPRRGSRSGAE